MGDVLPSASTRLLVLLGNPVAHSLSPAFQNAAIRHLGLDAVYVALRCDAAHAAALLRGVARAGGAGNVTVPHKAIAAECIEVPAPVVRRTGACNTFWAVNGRIHGDNTDVAGFRAAATGLVGSGLAGASVLLLGAGGAAAAAVCALIDDGAARITLHNRSPDRALTLARRFDPDGRAIGVARSVRELSDTRYDLVVNASSVGITDDEPLPLDLRTLPRPRAVLDLVYRRGGTTPWLRHARSIGITAAADGTGMLLGQGAAAFRCWFGIDAPLDVMSAALRGG